MAAHAQQAHIEARFTTWISDRKDYPEIHCSPEVLAALGELVQSGYDRYSWGGVEVGGILLGRKEAGVVQILSYRVIDCDHTYGPSFDLSIEDQDGMSHLLAQTPSGQDPNDLVPVGWFQSVSRRDIGITERDRKLHQRFFPEPWQVAMVVKRSKTNPLAVGFFCKESNGFLQLHSSPKEFTAENLQATATELTVSPAPRLATVAATPSVKVPELERERGGVSEELSQYAFLDLSEDPFSQTADPRFFYPAPQHLEAGATLLHSILGRKGYSTVVGEAGTGKSMVLQCLIEQLRARSIEFAFLFNTKITPEQFFELLAHDLNLKHAQPTKTSILIAFNEYLLERSQAGANVALIVDNAQKLAPDVLEEIELLGNLENRRGRLIQVVFAAQPDFDQTLDAAPLRGLRQRLLSRARLVGLSLGETAAYIESRMSTAGLPGQGIFPPSCLLEIHTLTGGVPRLINALCSRLISVCLERRTPTIDAEMLACAAGEIRLSPIG
jgi:general secretion pathway protein A